MVGEREANDYDIDFCLDWCPLSFLFCQQTRYTLIRRVNRNYQRWLDTWKRFDVWINKWKTSLYASHLGRRLRRYWKWISGSNNLISLSLLLLVLYPIKSQSYWNDSSRCVSLNLSYMCCWWNCWHMFTVCSNGCR